MPIVVKINPVRVEEVLIEASNEEWQDVLLCVWPLVRLHLDALGRDLEKLAERVLSEDERIRAQNGEYSTILTEELFTG